MIKKLFLVFTLVLCLVTNSVVAFAAEPVTNPATVSDEEILVIDFETQSISTRAGEFIGTFSNGTCTISGLPDYGGYRIIQLNNVPGTRIKCKISGNPNMHYRLEYMPVINSSALYVSEGVLGNGSTTPTTNLGYTGRYFVTLFAYSGYTNAQTLTLTFTSW